MNVSKSSRDPDLQRRPQRKIEALLLSQTVPMIDLTTDPADWLQDLDRKRWELRIQALKQECRRERNADRRPPDQQQDPRTLTRRS